MPILLEFTLLPGRPVFPIPIIVKSNRQRVFEIGKDPEGTETIVLAVQPALGEARPPDAGRPRQRSTLATPA